MLNRNGGYDLMIAVQDVPVVIQWCRYLTGLRVEFGVCGWKLASHTTQSISPTPGMKWAYFWFHRVWKRWPRSSMLLSCTSRQLETHAWLLRWGPTWSRLSIIIILDHSCSSVVRLNRLSQHSLINSPPPSLLYNFEMCRVHQFERSGACNAVLWVSNRGKPETGEKRRHQGQSFTAQWCQLKWYRPFLFPTGVCLCTKFETLLGLYGLRPKTRVAAVIF